MLGATLALAQSDPGLILKLNVRPDVMECRFSLIVSFGSYESAKTLSKFCKHGRRAFEKFPMGLTSMFFLNRLSLLKLHSKDESTTAEW